MKPRSRAKQRVAIKPRTVLVVCLVSLAVITAGAVAYITGHQDSTSATAAGTGGPPPPAVITSGTAPTGCLGGPQLDDTMLLTAQRRAPHTSTGAVEVAASFFRWFFRYPTPTAAEVNRVSDLFVPGQETIAEQALLSTYARNPNPAAGVIDNGAPFALSTAAGLWAVQPAGKSQDLLVTVRANFVVDGAVKADTSTSESFNMRWQDGAWRVTYLTPADTRRLSAGGTRFVAGC